MDEDPPRQLGVLSDEIDRLSAHIDQMMRAHRAHVDGRFDEQARRIDGLTVQVTATNGSVRELQRWRSFMEGVQAGAGGSWHVLIGSLGALVGLGSLITAILVLVLHHG